MTKAIKKQYQAPSMDELDQDGWNYVLATIGGEQNESNPVGPDDEEGV